MINCPNCGTENRDGSKFCNDCGHPLGQPAGVVCSMCGAQNPSGSDFCGECGARLTLLDAPAADALIMPDTIGADHIGLDAEGAIPSPDAVEDAGLPDWLERLRSAAQEEDAGGPVDDLSTVVSDESGVMDDSAPVNPFKVSDAGEPADDWLSQLRRSAPNEPDEEDIAEPPSVEPFVAIPEEPTGIGAETPAILTDEESEELPDWLSRLRGELKDDVEPRPIPGPDISATPQTGLRDTGGLAWLDEVVLGEVVPGAQEEDGETDARAPAISRAGDEVEPAVPDLSAEPTIVGAGIESAPVFSAESDDLPGEPTKWDSQEVLPPLEGITEIPDWLREMGPLGAEPEPADDLEDVIAGGVKEGLEPAVLPDWLQPGAGGDAAPLDDLMGDEEAGGLARADIPGWLAAMRPDAQAAGEAEYAIEAGDLEEDGVLAGLHDVIPVELSVATPPDTSRLGGLLGVLPEEDDGAGRFAEVVESIAPARPVPRAKKRRFSLLRLTLALVLLIVIAIPMVTDLVVFDGTSLPRAGVNATWAMIEDISPGDAVVVAYDFDPSTSGEMEPLADTLIDHVMRRNARVIAVSLLPAGPAVAQRSMERVAESHSAYAYGGLYANLGYLPGKEAALRSFAADPFGSSRIDYVSGRPASTMMGLSGLSTLDDVRLIIELGASAETVRWWIEQVGSQTDVPILAGVSAAVEPQIRPYSEGASPQIEGLVAGLAGAADYGELTGAGRVSTGELEALRWATALVLLVVFAGIFASPFIRRTDGSKS